MALWVEWHQGHVVSGEIDSWGKRGRSPITQRPPNGLAECVCRGHGVVGHDKACHVPMCLQSPSLMSRLGAAGILCLLLAAACGDGADTDATATSATTAARGSMSVVS
jgi:hypothetical protein